MHQSYLSYSSPSVQLFWANNVLLHLYATRCQTASLSSPVVLRGCIELAKEYQGIAKVAVGSPFCRFIPKFFSNR